MNQKETIAKAVRTFGFSKVALEVMRLDGEYVPKDLSLREMALSVTAKMAASRRAHAAIVAGIADYERAVG